MVTLSGEQLSFDYPGPLRAVDQIDVSVATGEMLVVLGPNGSGKSTLIKLLSGMLVPRSGRVELDGRGVRTLPLRDRARRLAMVPQQLPVLSDVTVDRFVLGGRYAHMARWRGPQSDDLAAIERSLELADAAGVGDRRLTDLSGGQRQRVLIARALAQQADVLLVDEPTTSLDPEHQVKVFDLLARLAADGRAVCVVTHDLNLASQFATRLCVLAGGRVVAGGTVDEVLRGDVLEPVYGPHLHFGRMPAPDGRPFVLPWLDAPAEP